MFNPKKIDIQGHRGARGLFPENTLTSFLGAIKLGVDTIEMDVVISKDLQVVVSHEAWMNELFCSLPDGSPLEENDKYRYNLFQLKYEEIALFDCGMRGHPDFPQQIKSKEQKPLLSTVIKEVELYTSTHQLKPVKYNIELKTETGERNRFNPEPEIFVRCVSDVLKKYPIHTRVNLQSFDLQILKEIKKQDASVQIALLVEDESSLEENLKKLGFVPQTYSPDYVLVYEALIKKVHQLNMKLIPWTVNEPSAIKRLLSWGVEGIISDYPDRVINIIKNEQA